MSEIDQTNESEYEVHISEEQEGVAPEFHGRLQDALVSHIIEHMEINMDDFELVPDPGDTENDDSDLGLDFYEDDDEVE